MPILKSAKKKLRQDKKRKAHNVVIKDNYKSALKEALGSKTGKAGEKKVSAAYSAVDKAAKGGIIHKKKAARLKSKVAKSKS